MAGKKGENSKKVAGNAKKVEAAASKQAAIDSATAREEDRKWAEGSNQKGASRKQADAEKKEAAARKKAEKDALLAEEEKDAKSGPKNSKTAVKKSGAKPSAGTLDLGQLDGPPSSTAALNASNIDDALSALDLTKGSGNASIERHPERRFKAAFAAFEERRMPELQAENKGLNLSQRKELLRKEFAKDPSNPFNQASASFDASKDQIKELKDAERKNVEDRLTAKS